ncbi:hypothetical protein [Fictibacillus enclensis]|uniref:hypothetical protein n=1 Tax=Fictibacillus enclensis TaxID=1017270 RepID=UPI0024C06ACF|nr:hypothetical protein [Fictibacillus enclensis]WHY72074.1 hypothetical protein QNH15_24305 [Fictibacillus enclensis]
MTMKAQGCSVKWPLVSLFRVLLPLADGLSACLASLNHSATKNGEAVGEGTGSE